VRLAISVGQFPGRFLREHHWSAFFPARNSGMVAAISDVWHFRRRLSRATARWGINGACGRPARRIPFLLGGAFGLLSMYLRRLLAETPVFLELKPHRCRVAAPI
jgi:hypothetical protein